VNALKRDDMDFIGLKVLPTNVPLVELETPSGDIVDLYNQFDLVAVTLDMGGLEFKFRTAEYFGVSKSSVVVLKFREIRNLRVEQPSDWAPEESSQIEFLHIRPQGQSPRVVFRAGGLGFEFDCAAVLLDVVLP
jgi:hypothetical protein